MNGEAGDELLEIINAENKRKMIFREALVNDIYQIQLVRNAVKENALSNPNLVTDADCEAYMTVRGKGWVCLVNGAVVGFSIVDLNENNIWALFIHPNYEAKGIGKKTTCADVKLVF